MNLTERRAILDATAALLRDHGLAGLKMDDVVARAGVDSVTLYGRWRSRAELVVELLQDAGAAPGALPDTGELRRDLMLVIDQLAQGLEQVGPLAASLMGPAGRDPELGRELRLFVLSWQEPLRGLIRRGIERDELPSGLDEDVATDLAASIIWFRQTLLGARTRTGLGQQLVDPLLRAWGHHDEH
jgi:AcrR family transcriptional regulator